MGEADLRIRLTSSNWVVCHVDEGDVYDAANDMWMDITEKVLMECFQPKIEDDDED
jgi:hypothetical protein